MSHALFQALAELQSFDDLEDLLDFACETIVSLGEWNTAFISFYLGDEAAYGAAGCEPGMKDRFHRRFLRTDPSRRDERRSQILRHAWNDTLICFLPEGEGPSPSSAFVPSLRGAGSWCPADRLMILMRDWDDRIIGLLSLDNPVDGNRPDEAALSRLVEVQRFIGLIGRIAENRFWASRLERSQRRFERAAACGRNWIWEVDAAGSLLYSSPALGGILGYGLADVLGKKIADLAVPADRTALDAWLRRSDHEGSLVARFVHRDGHEVTVETHGRAMPARGGEPSAAFLGSSRDITPQIRAQQALKASEATYRGIFESATDMFFIFDLDGVIVEANPAACRMHGYPYDALIGLPGAAIIHPSHHGRFEEFKREVRSGGRFHTEAIDVRRDGSAFDVEVYGTAFEFRGAPHMLAVVRDITDRKEMAERLLRQQKDESIATLAGGIAHDFNNFLVGILGSADLLLRGLPPTSGEADLSRQILGSAESLSGLTQQLLAYARGGKYRPEPLALDRVFEETLALAHGVRLPRVRVEIRFPTDIWPVEADRTQLQQVLMNLILNAFDAMGDEGGILRVDAANERRGEPWLCPQTGARDAGDYVWMRVSDTGSGMSEETKARLFEPFYTTKFQGRGLGLAAVLGVVRNHGGSIEVKSEPGCGASFHLRLPRSRRTPEPVAPRLPAGGSPARTLRVLLVDDEEIVRQIAGAMLESLGWSVLHAEDGPKALELFGEHADEIDVVLLDVQMPGMGGAEVFDMLKSLKPDVRVLLTSGYNETLAREGFDESKGIGGFLPKPYTLEELSRHLREAGAPA